MGRRRRSPAERLAPSLLERGRQLHGRRAWAEAYEALRAADEISPLDGEDLFLLATSAALLGREDDELGALERAYQAFVDCGRRPRARMAFWLTSRLLFFGDGRANG
jgi:hypothetical protein